MQFADCACKVIKRERITLCHSSDYELPLCKLLKANGILLTISVKVLRNWLKWWDTHVSYQWLLWSSIGMPAIIIWALDLMHCRQTVLIGQSNLTSNNLARQKYHTCMVVRTKVCCPRDRKFLLGQSNLTSNNLAHQKYHTYMVVRAKVCCPRDRQFCWANPT